MLQSCSMTTVQSPLVLINNDTEGDSDGNDVHMRDANGTPWISRGRGMLYKEAILPATYDPPVYVWSYVFSGPLCESWQISGVSSYLLKVTLVCIELFTVDGGNVMHMRSLHEENRKYVSLYINMITQCP